MTWSIEEGTERAPHWREENNDIEGGVLLWDGEPVSLPLRSTFRSWTTPWKARHHIANIPFENGWIVGLRLVTPAPPGCEDLIMFGSRDSVTENVLQIDARNHRAIEERERLEEAGLVDSFVGDEWDFSYNKTAYDYPGAYVQWHLLMDDSEVREAYKKSDPFSPVPDVDILQLWLAFVAALPSDPAAAAALQENFIKLTNEFIEGERGAD